MKTLEKEVATGSKDKGNYQEWKINVPEYEKGDFTVAWKDGVKPLGEETVLSLVNRQLATDLANESRREKTAGAPKRMAVEDAVAMLMAPPFNFDKEKAEAHVRESMGIR